MADKRQQWEMIKSQAPDVAEWLGNMSKVFGKPASLRVELEKGEVVTTGQFKEAHPRLVLGKIRTYGYGN